MQERTAVSKISSVLKTGRGQRVGCCWCCCVTVMVEEEEEEEEEEGCGCAECVERPYFFSCLFCFVLFFLLGNQLDAQRPPI